MTLFELNNFCLDGNIVSDCLSGTEINFSIFGFWNSNNTFVNTDVGLEILSINSYMSDLDVYSYFKTSTAPTPTLTTDTYINC